MVSGGWGVVAVLTVAKVTSGQAAGYGAYLEGRTQAAELGDYYLAAGERVEAPGRWVSGAPLIGADPGAAVSGEQLHQLMAVRHPATGLPLRRVGGNGEAVSALDATFSAPKSVSAVWALASPQLRQAIEAAHEAAVDRALTYAIEQVPMVRQRIDKQRVDHVPAAGLVATSWRHTTARAVAEQPPDPQLHSHVLLHAAVRADGETVAINSRSVFVHRRELGAAYRTHLAHQLSALGFAVKRGTGRGGRYFEIAGIPEALLDRWSSRHHQVQAAITARLADKRAALQATVAGGGPPARAAAAALDGLARSGRLLPAEERYMATHTRTPKGLHTHGDLDHHWYAAAQEFGLDSRSVQDLRTHLRAPAPASDRELLERLTEFDATFTAREARAVALEASPGVDVEEALGGLEQLRFHGALLQLADGRYTTVSHRAAERATLAAAGQLTARRPAPLPSEGVDREALALDAELRAHGAQLSGEQHAALELACADRGLVILEGQAGTGKSTTLTAIARAHQSDGRRVLVTSTAALAAQRLAAELQHAGVNTQARSTAALHAALNTGTLTLDPRTTVIHDEAALAATRDHHHLFEAVQAAGARLILVGDPRQNQAVGAGGLWPDLEHTARAQAAHVCLTQIVRAQDPADRRDQTQFRSGHHERALQGYADRGRVHLAEDQRHAEDHALDAAHHDRCAGRRTIVICQTSNEQLDALNARAQAIRLEDGQLGDPVLPVAGRPYGLRAGDDIQIRRAVDHPQLGRVANGTPGRVLTIDSAGEQATLQLGDGRTAAFTRSELDHASVRLGYVQHPFPAQGHTTDTTHLIVAEHTTQEGAYVALTRARQHTHIHATHPDEARPDQRDREQPGQLQLELSPPAADPDPLTVLAERMGRTEPDLASIHTPLAHERHLARQLKDHAPTPEPGSDGGDDDDRRERELTGRLAWARAARDLAQRVVDSYPAGDATAHQHALAEAQGVAERVRAWERHTDQLHDQLGRLGLLARRRAPGQALTQQLAAADAAVGQLDQRLIACQHAAETHRAIVQQWEAEHPDTRPRLHAAAQAHEALVDDVARHRLQHPGAHLTRTLGRAPRVGHPGYRVWAHAALAIERYRARYAIDPAEPDALGPEPDGVQQRQQRYDHDLAASIITHATITPTTSGLFPQPPQPAARYFPPTPRINRGPRLGL